MIKIKSRKENSVLKDGNDIFYEKDTNPENSLDVNDVKVKKYLNYLYPISFLIISIMLIIFYEQFISASQENSILKKEVVQIKENLKKSEKKVEELELNIQLEKKIKANEKIQILNK